MSLLAGLMADLPNRDWMSLSYWRPYDLQLCIMTSSKHTL